MVQEATLEEEVVVVVSMGRWKMGTVILSVALAEIWSLEYRSNGTFIINGGCMIRSLNYGKHEARCLEDRDYDAWEG